MNRKFENKTVLVTGGTSGLGRAICLEFAKHGANVVLAGRREKEGNDTLRLIRELGVRGLFTKTDISKSEDVKNLIQSALDTFGNLDFAINNAGIYGKAAFLSKYEEEDWDSVINTNLKGTFLSMKYELSAMLPKKSGSIINIASVNGLVSMPYGVSAYAASKHGILGLTKTAALEMAGRGIRVNALCPGGIKTEMLEGVFRASPEPSEAEKGFLSLHPMRRFANPEEIAKACVWLSSEEASYITGASIPIDGGFTAQ